MSNELTETYKHIKEVNRLILKFCQELLDRAIEHDESKLHEPEASVFAKYEGALLKTEYGKDYDKQLVNLEEALTHHYANNRHHPQHFQNGIRDMTLVDLVELYLDWHAASKRQLNGNIHKSLDVNQVKYNYTDELKQIMKNTVDVVESF